VLLAVVMAVVAVRLAQVQVLQHDYWQRESDGFIIKEIPLPAARGAILDRMGRELAVDRPAVAVYVHPPRLTDPLGTARDLGTILGVSPDSILKRISECRGPFLYIDRQVDASLKPRIQELAKREDQAVGTEPSTRRVYPKGSVAADVLGFAGIERTGLAGIEAACDKLLSGQPGHAVGERDATGWPIPHRTRVIQPARDGTTLKLTIDLSVQEACERELAEAVKSNHAKAGCAVVLETRTGNVLAACDYPTYDPNSWEGTKQSTWAPRFATWTYEPGSTIKPLVAAMALDAGVITENSTFTCNKTYTVGRHKLECRHAPSGGHGTLSVADILKYSCNIGALQIGLKAKGERMSRLFTGLGFTEPPTTELPSQYQVLPTYLVPTWCATSSYGQGISITPLHLAAAYGALANGGERMRPRFIVATIDPNGTVSERPPVREGRVFGAEASRRVLEMLTRVVEDTHGTGHEAKVPGLVVAGKTGTAEIPGPGGYLANQWIVSFVGVLPAGDPRYVIAVVIDRPTGTAYGGTVAAPVFRDIAESIVTTLQIPIDNPKSDKQ